MPSTIDQLNYGCLVAEGAAVVDKITDAVTTYYAWASGSASGGPNRDGKYPLPLPGLTGYRLVTCPAALPSRAEMAQALADILALQSYAASNADLEKLVGRVAALAAAKTTAASGIRVENTAAALLALPGPFKVGDGALVIADPAGDVANANGYWRYDGTAFVWVGAAVPASVASSFQKLFDDVPQRIGRPAASPPIDGGPVSSGMIIWNTPTQGPGNLDSLTVWVHATGTFRIAAYTKSGTTVTRQRYVDFTASSTGLRTFTPADFGVFPVAADEYIGLAGLSANMFTASSTPADGDGWWTVEATLPVRTLSALYATSRIEAGFALTIETQTVTAAQMETAFDAVKQLQNTLTAAESQIIGRGGDIEDGGGVSAGMFVMNDPVTVEGFLTSINLNVKGAGTITLARYTKSGTTITRTGKTTFTTSAAGNYTFGPADYGTFPVEVDEYLGLSGTGLFGAIGGVADGGGWWAVDPTPETRTVGTPNTTNQLQLRFNINGTRQVVNGLDFQELVGRVGAFEELGASINGLYAADTQVIGRTADPISGPGVADSMFIWANPVTQDGTLGQLKIYVVATGTFTVARYSKVGNTVTRQKQVTFTASTIGLQTFTEADFGIFPVLEGEYLGLYGQNGGSGMFGSFFATADGAGWWGVVASPTVRTVGTPLTVVRLEASFVVDQYYQKVTAESFDELSNDIESNRLAIIATQDSVIELAEQVAGIVIGSSGGVLTGPAEVALLGDSRIADSQAPVYGETANGAQLNGIGLAGWVQAMGQGRYVFPLDLNFGIAGQKTSEMRARLDAVIACRAQVVGFLGVTNNSASAVAPASTINDLSFMFASLVAAGKRVFVIAEYPRGSATVAGTPAAPGVSVPVSQSRLSGQPLAYHGQVRDWIIDEATQMPGVWVIDPWPLIGDPLTTTGDIRPFATRDSLHLSPYGAATVAPEVVKLLNEWYPTAQRFGEVNNSFLYDATNNPRGCLLLNPTMAGTGGTHDSARASADTGPMATSWISDRASMTGFSGTVAYSKVAGAAGPLKDFTLQQVAIAGTTDATANPIVYARQDISVSKLSVGDEVECGIWVEIDADPAGLATAQIAVQVVDDLGNGLFRSLTSLARGGGGVSNVVYPIPGGFTGEKALLHIAPRFTIHSGLALLRVQVQFQLCESSTIDVTARFGRAFARKI